MKQMTMEEAAAFGLPPDGWLEVMASTLEPMIREDFATIEEDLRRAREFATDPGKPSPVIALHQSIHPVTGEPTASVGVYLAVPGGEEWEPRYYRTYYAGYVAGVQRGRLAVRRAA